jgi:bacillithiol system protein YtxJ
MGLFGRGNTKSGLSWKKINSIAELDEALAGTDAKPALFFKHSTRCSISSMALSRLEQNKDLSDAEMDLYFVDLIQHRDVSNSLAEKSNVVHQSPQAIVMKHGQVIHHASHGAIDSQEIIQLISK